MTVGFSCLHGTMEYYNVGIMGQKRITSVLVKGFGIDSYEFSMNVLTGSGDNCILPGPEFFKPSIDAGFVKSALVCHCEEWSDETI